MASTAIKLKTAATSNAVTTAEAKLHLRVDFADADQNTYIDGIVESAQRQVESFTNLVLSDTTWYFNLSSFPSGGITLPFSPVKSISSITYYDTANDLQTLSSDDYYYDVSQLPTLISYVDSAPATYENRQDAVIVEFVTGYTSPAAIPEGLKHAIKLLMTDLYEVRTDMPREKFTAWKSLAYPYRVFHSTTENE
ncbi:MAG: head-tail connector protein [Nitrosomonadaceae bacterium]